MNCDIILLFHSNFLVKGKKSNKSHKEFYIYEYGTNTRIKKKYQRWMTPVAYANTTPDIRILGRNNSFLQSTIHHPFEISVTIPVDWIWRSVLHDVTRKRISNSRVSGESSRKICGTSTYPPPFQWEKLRDISLYFSAPDQKTFSQFVRTPSLAINWFNFVYSLSATRR